MHDENLRHLAREFTTKYNLGFDPNSVAHDALHAWLGLGVTQPEEDVLFKVERLLEKKAYDNIDPVIWARLETMPSFHVIKWYYALYG